MTVVSWPTDERLRVGVLLTTTNDTTILAPETEYGMIVLDLILVNDHTADVVVVLKWNDGSNDYNLISQSLGAKIHFAIPIKDFPLEPGDTLIAQAASANVIDVTASYINKPPPGTGWR